MLQIASNKHVPNILYSFIDFHVNYFNLIDWKKKFEANDEEGVIQYNGLFQKKSILAQDINQHGNRDLLINDAETICHQVYNNFYGLVGTNMSEYNGSICNHNNLFPPCF